jgi:hypothetical protein
MIIISQKVLIRATRRHLPEDDNHHSHRRGNLKSYKDRYLPTKLHDITTWKTVILMFSTMRFSYVTYKIIDIDPCPHFPVCVKCLEVYFSRGTYATLQPTPNV